MGVTPVGWIFLVFAWSIVIGLVSICFSKVIKRSSNYR